MHRTLILGYVVSAVLVAATPPRGVPDITVIGGSPTQREQLGIAVSAFLSVGLQLPDIEVGFSDERADCNGGMGLFETAVTPWRITICSEAEFVYLHELAHAWELAHLDDSERYAFMEHRGHSNWADPTAEWGDRGVEDAAFVVQQGLMDRPLPEVLTQEQASRLQAFELLTGVASPRLRG